MRSAIAKRLEQLRVDKGDLVPISEIAEIVDGILNSLSGDVTGNDMALYHEVQSLAAYIESAKSEIAAIRPQDIHDEHIQTATDELDAIVRHTEDATGNILDAAEKLETLADTLDETAAAAVRDAVTGIYESCNFQDITGQRITRVVRALKDIESKVYAIVQAFGEEGTAQPAKPADAAATRKEADATDGKPSDADLLNGPQLPESAQSQEDIDALFASLK